MDLPVKRRSAQEPRDQEIRRLGEALNVRIADVVEILASLNAAAGSGLDDADRENFERIGEIATTFVAQWMEGSDPRAGMDAGHDAWNVFGHVAAAGAAPLNEVTKRCLRWRDAVLEVLRTSATEKRISDASLTKAMWMAQRTLDVTLVRMCEVFERERARTADELARRQEELAFMATHDPLTGLPNRTLILDRGEQMLGRARRQQTPVAALLIDLDNFTAINDTLGHAAGDELLQAIAARLDAVVRDIDALGRIGGDEFVVLAEEVTAGAGAELIAERLMEALKAPFTLAGGEHPGLTVTASIGVATGERASVEDFLRDADIAMHRAKDGRNRHVVFESDMQDVVQTRMELDMDLRGALEREEFFLLYQPTFDLRGMVPTGVETLLRWKRPSQGVVQPNDFIPLLEETGLIVEVGRWVLAEACGQAARWRDAGHAIGMAVNVSARQLETDEFIDDVRDAISRSGIEPDALTLEITETTLMRNPDETARRLCAIKDLGVRIAIDDFGTGYSSLGHLQRFPVDALKIDRSFISQLTENAEGETLLRTLVQLGKALSIETLAEGIELEHQLTLLREEDCDSGQGFLFARPLAAGATEEFLTNWGKASLADTVSEPAPVGALAMLDGVPATVGGRAQRLLAAGGESA
jgi:diguanylate cyclase (GGDEF)-like protein